MLYSRAHCDQGRVVLNSNPPLEAIQPHCQGTSTQNSIHLTTNFAPPHLKTLLQLKTMLHLETMLPFTSPQIFAPLHLNLCSTSLQSLLHLTSIFCSTSPQSLLHLTSIFVPLFAALAAPVHKSTNSQSSVNIGLIRKCACVVAF